MASLCSQGGLIYVIKAGSFFLLQKIYYCFSFTKSFTHGDKDYLIQVNNTEVNMSSDILNIIFKFPLIYIQELILVL